MPNRHRIRTLMAVILRAALLIYVYAVRRRAEFCRNIERQHGAAANRWLESLRFTQDLMEYCQGEVWANRNAAKHSDLANELGPEMTQKEAMIQFHREMEERFARVAAEPWRFAPPADVAPPDPPR